MLQWIFILIACLICACSSAKPVDNPTAENPITQPHTDTNPAPSPISPKEAIPMNNHDNAIDSWIDPLKPGFVMPKSDEATQILEFVRNHSKHESFVARIKLGNMAFVEGTTPTKARDGQEKSSFCAVLLSENMFYYELPNTQLLTRFITDLRANPDALSLDKRIMFTMMLAQGFDHHLSQDEMASRNFESKYGIAPVDPKWTDDGHTITIDYYQMSVEGIQVSTPQKCHVIIDETMKANISCEKV